MQKRLLIVLPLLLSTAVMGVLLFSWSETANANDPALAETALTAAGQVWEVNTDAQGHLWLSDYLADEVWQVNPTAGVYTIYHGLDNVNDARLDSEGNLWRSDFDNNQLGRVSLDTNTATTWPLPGVGHAWGTAIDESSGKVWVTDALEPFIHRFNPSTTELCSYEVPNDGISQYLVVEEGEVWLGDWQQGRILKFDPEFDIFTIWHLPANSVPKGLSLDEDGNLWWADRGLGVLARLAAASNQLTQYALPVGSSPEMLTFNNGSMWYTEDWDLTVGVLNPTVASGTTSTPNRSTSAVTPFCNVLGAGTSISVTVSSDTATWATEAITHTVDSAGWSVFELPHTAWPWGIAVSEGRIWFADKGRQKLVWLCYWADLDCGCEVGAEDVTEAANAWRCSVGESCYDPRIDVNGDGVITVLDVGTFTPEWGWVCTP